MYALQWTAENLDTIPKMGVIRPGETENAVVSFRKRLTSFEKLSGTPTIEVSVETGDDDETDHLTLSNEAITDADILIPVDGVDVRQKFVVTFRVALSPDATVGTVYRLAVTANTAASSPQTLIEEMLLRVI